MVIKSKARHDLTLRSIKREIVAGRDVAYWHRRIMMRWMPRTAKQTSLPRMPKQLVKEGFN